MLNYTMKITQLNLKEVLDDTLYVEHHYSMNLRPEFFLLSILITANKNFSKLKSHKIQNSSHTVMAAAYFKNGNSYNNVPGRMEEGHAGKEDIRNSYIQLCHYICVSQKSRNVKYITYKDRKLYYRQ